MSLIEELKMYHNLNLRNCPISYKANNVKLSLSYRHMVKIIAMLEAGEELRNQLEDYVSDRPCWTDARKALLAYELAAK